MPVRHRNPTLHLAGGRFARLLKLVEDGGIVRTIVLSSEGMFPDLGGGLEGKSNLTKVAVVETGDNEDKIPWMLGTYAADMLSSELKGKALDFT